MPATLSSALAVPSNHTVALSPATQALSAHWYPQVLRCCAGGRKVQPVVWCLCLHKVVERWDAIHCVCVLYYLLLQPWLCSMSPVELRRYRDHVVLKGVGEVGPTLVSEVCAVGLACVHTFFSDAGPLCGDWLMLLLLVSCPTETNVWSLFRRLPNCHQLARPAKLKLQWKLI